MPDSPEQRPSNNTLEIADIEKRVDEWVSSKKGTEQMLAAREAARDAAEKVLSDAEVQPEQLHKTVNL